MAWCLLLQGQKAHIYTHSVPRYCSRDPMQMYARVHLSSPECSSRAWAHDSFVLVKRSEWITDLGKLGKAKTPPPWDKTFCFYPAKHAKMSFRWYISLPRGRKANLRRGLSNNKSMHITEWNTADCWNFVPQRYQTAAFQCFPKIPLFLYKTNFWILDEFINNFQATEIYEFDKYKRWWTLNQKNLKVLRTSQKAFGSVQTQTITVAAWTLCPCRCVP